MQKVILAILILYVYVLYILWNKNKPSIMPTLFRASAASGSVPCGNQIYVRPVKCYNATTGTEVDDKFCANIPKPDTEIRAPYCNWAVKGGSSCKSSMDGNTKCLYPGDAAVLDFSYSCQNANKQEQPMSFCDPKTQPDPPSCTLPDCSVNWKPLDPTPETIDGNPVYTAGTLKNATEDSKYSIREVTGDILHLSCPPGKKISILPGSGKFVDNAKGSVWLSQNPVDYKDIKPIGRDDYLYKQAQGKENYERKLSDIISDMRKVGQDPLEGQDKQVRVKWVCLP